RAVAGAHGRAAGAAGARGVTGSPAEVHERRCHGGLDVRAVGGGAGMRRTVRRAHDAGPLDGRGAVNGPGRGARPLHVYLWLVMGGLLLQGAGSLLLDLRPDVQAATPWPLATIMNGNPPHAWLHIVWGIAGLAVLGLFRTPVVRLWLGLVFGV